jgi:type IV secretory pathway VirB2 component (pilin)
MVSPPLPGKWIDMNMKKLFSAAVATVALVPGSAFAGAGNYPFVQNLADLMDDVTGPIGGIAIAIACACIGIVIMMRGGGAAIASGVTFVLGAGVIAWSATSPTTFGVAAGGILPLIGS